MTTATANKTEIDLVDHKVLLGMFRDYVDECIRKDNFSNPSHPLSFDEWYNYEFLPNKEKRTRVVVFHESHEEAAGGHLTGSSPYQPYQVRIPASALNHVEEIVDRDNQDSLRFFVDSLRYFGRMLAQRLNNRLPTVLYAGKVVYKWSWD